MIDTGIVQCDPPQPKQVAGSFMQLCGLAPNGLLGQRELIALAFEDLDSVDERRRSVVDKRCRKPVETNSAASSLTGRTGFLRLDDRQRTAQDPRQSSTALDDATSQRWLWDALCLRINGIWPGWLHDLAQHRWWTVWFVRRHSPRLRYQYHPCGRRRCAGRGKLRLLLLSGRSMHCRVSASRVQVRMGLSSRIKWQHGHCERHLLEVR